MDPAPAPRSYSLLGVSLPSAHRSSHSSLSLAIAPIATSSSFHPPSAEPSTSHQPLSAGIAQQPRSLPSIESHHSEPLLTGLEQDQDKLMRPPLDLATAPSPAANIQSNIGSPPSIALIPPSPASSPHLLHRPPHAAQHTWSGADLDVLLDLLATELKHGAESRALSRIEWFNIRNRWIQQRGLDERTAPSITALQAKLRRIHRRGDWRYRELRGRGDVWTDEEWVEGGKENEAELKTNEKEDEEARTAALIASIRNGTRVRAARPSTSTEPTHISATPLAGQKRKRKGSTDLAPLWTSAENKLLVKLYGLPHALAQRTLADATTLVANVWGEAVDGESIHQRTVTALSLRLSTLARTPRLEGHAMAKWLKQAYNEGLHHRAAGDAPGSSRTSRDEDGGGRPASHLLQPNPQNGAFRHSAVRNGVSLRREQLAAELHQLRARAGARAMNEGAPKTGARREEVHQVSDNIELCQTSKEPAGGESRPFNSLDHLKERLADVEAKQRHLCSVTSGAFDKAREERTELSRRFEKVKMELDEIGNGRVSALARKALEMGRMVMGLHQRMEELGRKKETRRGKKRGREGEESGCGVLPGAKRLNGSSEWAREKERERYEAPQPSAADRPFLATSTAPSYPRPRYQINMGPSGSSKLEKTSYQAKELSWKKH